MYQFNQMRRLRFLPIGLLVLLSCSKETVKEPVNREMGEVCITLSSTGDGEDVRPKTRSVEENVPDAGDFEVEIYNSQGIRIYRDNYANSAGKKIPLNSGEYRLLAQHGDSAGVGFGSEKAWFSADQTFTVRPQTSESVSAVARMNKVKVAVSLGPNLLASYSDLYTVVRNAGSSKELKFVKDETRAGYILPGVLEMEIYALVDGEWKYYPVDLGSLSDTEDMSVYAPNTFVSFNLELYSGEGSLGGTVIEVDVTTDDVTKEFLVPVEAAPKDAPAAAMYGFTDNLFSFIEGVDYENVQIDLIAKGGIKSCTLNVMESPYLEGKGITGSIDLVSPDPAVQETLESLGFNWVKSMKDKRLGSIDFSRLSDYIKYEPSNAFSGRFSVTVTDNLDRSASTPEFTIAQSPVEFSFSPADYNAFARRIRGLAATTVNGNPAKIEVQYSTDGRSWTSVEPMSADAAKATFPDIAGLEPETEYQVRAVYNDNPQTATAPVTLTTEADQQVGNAGFEEWTTQTHKFIYDLGLIEEEHNIDWDLPWTKEQWWDVNSKKAMPSSTSITSGNWNWVRFPTVSYTTDAFDGNRSAMIYSVNVGDWLTATASVGERIAGELFIGKADDSGNHSTEGHEFAGRPDKFKFQYRYQPNGSETFYLKFELKDKDGETIASVEKSDLGVSAGWSGIEFPLTYSDITRKAASIYIIFKSTSAEKPGVTGNYELSIRDGQKYTGNFGSILYLDNIELIYE